MKPAWYKLHLLIAIAAGVIAISINACGGGKANMADPFGTGTKALATSKHVVLVMEENQGYATVAGNTGGWPHLNAMIAKGALATNYYADAHFSIPNYFMLTTGQTLTFDDNSTTIWNVDNIARHMLAANVSFKVYAEGISRGYLGGNTGLYVRRHNPFAMLSDLAN